MCSCIGNGPGELSGDRCPVEVISSGVICEAKASSRTPPGLLAIYQKSVHGESLTYRGRDLVTTVSFTGGARERELVDYYFAS